MPTRAFGALVLALCFGAAACGGDNGSSSSPYADKCRVACDPSAVMECTSMDPTACRGACEALLSGLSALCATCVTQGNAWLFSKDHRSTGAGACSGYAFPSVTMTSGDGCGDSCK
jgi:hypothetical protein